MPDYADEDAAYDAAVKAEWGVWVADGPIYISGALAFVDGSPVPTSTVERLDLEAGHYVRKAGQPKQAVLQVSAAPPEGDPVVIAAEVASPEPAEEVPADPPSKK